MPSTTPAAPSARLRELQALLAADRARMRILGIVAGLGLPDCWVAAGFVRNAVWDHLHGYPASPPSGDIDVIRYDRSTIDPALDRRLEARLRACDASLDWSVKNQARMHLRNDDAPYASATAVSVRLSRRGAIEVAAPFGLDDLFSLVVRPTPRFMGAKLALYRKRVVDKAWPVNWPGLHVEDPSA